MQENSKLKVYIVDDDNSICKALSMLIESADMNVQSFQMAKDFLNCKILEVNSCLIADIEMKGISGFDLQKELKKREINIPIIFLSAFDSKEYRQIAKKAGAVSYLTKPVDDQALLDAVYWALSDNSITNA